MKHAVVAVAQQSLRVYRDLDSYRQGVERFFRLAESKHARLIVFPERTALMIIPPLLEGFRSQLAREAEQHRQGKPSLWEKARAGVLSGIARLMRTNLPAAVMQALEEMPEIIWQHFTEVFADLAYEYKVTVVAGSGFFLDPDTRERRHMATVFGPDGTILGIQSKVLLSDADRKWAEPGSGWQAIETPVGRLGITFGEEVMYPEVGRWLAYQGVEAIVTLLATTDQRVAFQVRDGLWARVIDNQVFGALACTVGLDPFTATPAPRYEGRSALLAPHDLTPRYNGVLVEAGTGTAEVLVTARWDFDKLRQYWQSARLPLRRRMPVKGTGKVLAALYSREVTLEEAVRSLPEFGRQPLPAHEVPGTETARKESGEEVTTAPAAGDQEPHPAPSEEQVGVPAADVMPEEVEAQKPAEQPSFRQEAAAPEEVAPAAEPQQPPGRPHEEAEVPRQAVAERQEPQPTGPQPAESPKETSPETELTLADVLARRPDVARERSERPEEEAVSESLWRTVKAELERAAAVLRSLTSTEGAKPAVDKKQKSGQTGSGWFHRMVQEAQQRQQPETWEEY